jgi:ABC-type sugar transport system substrate-binding protein
MKKKYINLSIRVFLLAFLISILLSSIVCAQEKTLKVGFIGCYLGADFINAGLWSAQKEMETLEKDGYKIEWYVQNSMEPIKQLEIAETMVKIPVDVVMIEPVDQTMSVLIETFHNAGIPYVCTNGNILEGPDHAYIAMGNYNCGIYAANALIDLCKLVYGPTPEDWVKNGGKNGKAIVLNIAGLLSQSNGIERYNAFIDVWQPIADKTPGLEVITKPYDWETDKAYEIAQNMWTLYGDEIIGVFGAGDPAITAGVVPAWKAAGVFKKVGEPGHIPTVSIDGTQEALRLMREKETDVVIIQDAFGEGRVSAIIMKKLLKGEPLDEVGSVLWEGLKPLVMDIFPDEFGPEYEDAVELWAPAEVFEMPAGVHYRLNNAVCSAWEIGIPPDSKLLWGNVMAFIDDGRWPW